MKRKIRDAGVVTYWKSMVDVITALMMVILLVLMFFVLSFLINREKEYDYTDYDGYHGGDYAHNENEGDYTLTPTPTPTPAETHLYDENGGGGGNGETSVTTIETTHREDYPGLDGTDRAAIYAVLIDEETGRVIETPEVIFQLYSSTDARQSLSTHYPELITYTEFETTDEGDFYLPEKVNTGIYYFHQMTEVPGYDYSSDTYFEVDKAYEWDEPLVVEIPLGAAKNNIQVQINDATTGAGLPNIVFDVVANGDIRTPDGTIRYRNGDVATTFQCNETGYGLSDDLYLGNYILVPRNLPLGYAAPEASSREITLERRTEAGAYAPLVVLESEMTKVSVTVRDESDENLFVPSMTYELTCSDDNFETTTYVTNNAGHFEITELVKNATYRLQEIDTSQGYMSNDEVYEFTVDSMGYINGSATYTIDINSRMIRLDISTLDRISRQPLSGYDVEVYNQSNVLIDRWTSDGTVHRIDGIKPGVYKLKIVNSNDETIIVVEDVSDVQKFSTSIMTTKSFVLLSGISLAIVFLILLLVIHVIPMMRKRRKDNKYKNDKYKKVNNSNGEG